MKWFAGSVNDAVNEAKERKSYFVVYIDGLDNLSAMMTSVINSEDISKILERGNFVSIRVIFGSSEYHQFVEIYKHVPVPSFFLIGLNGIPLAVVSNSSEQDVNSLHEQILEAIVLKDKFRSRDNSFALLAKETNKAVKETPREQVSVSSEVADFKKESNDVLLEVIPFVDSTNTYVIDETNSQKQNKQCTKDSYTIERDLGEASGSSQQDMDTKTEQEIVPTNDDTEETSAKQFKQDNELNKSNSQNRKQKDELVRGQELKQEKLRNELDRKRVLNAIAMDKQERVAKQEEMKAIRFSTVNNEPETKVPGRAEQTSLTDNQTRIQFRKANGATYTEVFDVDNVLNELRQYVIDNVRLHSTQFQLATAFPRHVFTESEYTNTLNELNLVPNAVILIITLTEENSSTSYIYSQLSNTFWFITSPIAGLYNTIVGNSSQPQVSNEALRRPTEDTHQRQRTTNEGTSNQQNSNGQRNVYTINDINKDNNNRDRNDVWNGNSTQQIQ